MSMVRHKKCRRSQSQSAHHRSGLSQQVPPGFFLTYADLRYDLGFATIKSLTSYQKTRNQIDVDRSTQSTLGYYDVQPYWNNSVDAASQEINLTSNGDGKFNYIVGGYFLYQKLGQNILELEGSDANPTFNVTYPIKVSNLPYNFNYGLDSSQKRYSYAAFAQTKYKVTDALSATIGLRFNHDDFNSTNLTNFGLYGGPVLASTHENALTGKGEIDYAVTPHNMLYASVSRGYKPGGVSNNSTPLLVPLTYKPEHVWAYEIGSKNKFADGKITLNAAAFYYNYANMQYQEEDPVPYQGGVSNIPKTHIWGAEAEATFQATHRLSFDGNLTYLGGSSAIISRSIHLWLIRRRLRQPSWAMVPLTITPLPRVPSRSPTRTGTRRPSCRNGRERSAQPTCWTSLAANCVRTPSHLSRQVPVSRLQ
jgi:iron complex outermembrane receptor protein